MCRTDYLRSSFHLFDSHCLHTVLSATRTLRIFLSTGVLVESRFALQCLLASEVSYYPYACSIQLCKNYVPLTDKLLIWYLGVWTDSHNSLTMTRISKTLTLCATYKDIWSFCRTLRRLPPVWVAYLTILRNSCLLSSLGKLSNLISISMQPNSWVTHISWHKKRNQIRRYTWNLLTSLLVQVLLKLPT